MVVFYVDHNLYKGHLLVAHQIVESSRLPDRVHLVEVHFTRWLRQMQKVLTQGQQLRQDPPDVGPHNELEYWQQQLARYTSIVEFVSSKPFLHHLECMVQSKSKLVARWRRIENQLSAALNVARDNVRYVGSLFPYWDPLYRCSPERMHDYLKSLIVSLRSVYTTSRYYNTSDHMSSFLVKATNQLTTACKNYLTEHDQVPIFEQDSVGFVQKIDACERLLAHYRAIYFATLADMPADDRWDCSPMYLFGVMDMFRRRVQRIKRVIEIKVTYGVLDRVRISGMDTFGRLLKEAHERMVNRPYAMLDHRVKQFDRDYAGWNDDVELAEQQMQQFVKQTVQPIETTEGKLLVLQRFDRLQLDCLCMDRRYLDVFKLFERELVQLKDMCVESASKSQCFANAHPFQIQRATPLPGDTAQHAASQRSHRLGAIATAAHRLPDGHPQRPAMRDRAPKRSAVGQVLQLSVRAVPAHRDAVAQGLVRLRRRGSCAPGEPGAAQKSAHQLAGSELSSVHLSADPRERVYAAHAAGHSAAGRGDGVLQGEGHGIVRNHAPAGGREQSAAHVHGHVHAEHFATAAAPAGGGLQAGPVDGVVDVRPSGRLFRERSLGAGRCWCVHRADERHQGGAH